MSFGDWNGDGEISVGESFLTGIMIADVLDRPPSGGNNNGGGCGCNGIGCFVVFIIASIIFIIWATVKIISFCNF